MTGLLEPVFKETHLGRAEVRNTFRIKGVGMIAGCYVLDGILKRDAEVRVVARRRGDLHRAGSVRCGVSRTTPTKCAPDSSAASASPISTTLKSATCSNASPCRS